MGRLMDGNRGSHRGTGDMACPQPRASNTTGGPSRFKHSTPLREAHTAPVATLESARFRDLLSSWFIEMMTSRVGKPSGDSDATGDVQHDAHALGQGACSAA